jgi:peptidoglycan/LPS O-acetylase OafA/YrhL
MKTQIIQQKSRYEILDGLRGVAAIMVVAFHILEAHATSHFDQVINHGYLAVDFFFVLSGFVIGYAYDDRWAKGMSIGTFCKRRLIRLQPMVVIGMAIGAICFYFQDSVLWSEIHNVPVAKMLLFMFLGMLLIPVTTNFDIRGWGENYPLNGPAWSLLLEYIANILYALFIRRFSKTALSIFVFVAGCVLIHYAVTSPMGDLIGGWSLNGYQMRIGLTRLMYPFFAGLLLSRLNILKNIKNTFLPCSLLIIIALSIPRIGNAETLWANGIYDSLIIIFLFPFIVWLGASSSITGKYLTKICKFLGDISYPLYITHFPFIYIYMGWVANEKRSISDTYGIALLVFFGSIALAYASLKLYDEPVRKWLSKKIFKN